MGVQISYDPKGWHGTDTAPNAPEEVRLRTATQAALDAVVAADDVAVQAVILVANGTARATITKARARTITGIRVRRQVAVASALGTVTLAIQDGDGTTLLSAANIDAEALTNAFVAQTLTATTADLSLANGEPVILTLTSNNADATGGPVIVEITYAEE
jgi:hypothetical protein